MNLKLVLLFCALFCSVKIHSANTEAAKIYGKGISLDSKTAISEILATPEKYLGKTVLIEGRVVDVCKKRGCWMEIASDKEFQTIRVKVNDGEIIFPLVAKGKLAKVEGILEKFELTKEQTIMRMQHHAEEQGLPFDSTSVTEGMTVYQLKGIGAVISE